MFRTLVKLRLGAVLLGGLAAVGVSPAPAAPPSPQTAAKLRRRLPFPEEALHSILDLSIGLSKSPRQGAEFSRFDTALVPEIVAIRRSLAGGLADADRYRALGRLYRQAGLPLKSAAAFGRSQALYSMALKRHPSDGKSLAGYGQTLLASGQTTEAVLYFRSAVKIAPNSAEVWAALGAALYAGAATSAKDKGILMREAAASYDKAVSLAPDNPLVWSGRGYFRTWQVPQFYGEPPSFAGISDYERAAALSPDDPYAQAMVPSVESIVFETTHHLYTSVEAAKREPKEADNRAHESLRRITAIAQSTHGARSAGAYDARSWIQFEFFCNPQEAQKSLSLALRQNPRRRDAADYQIHIAAVVGNYPLMAFVCRRELRLRPAVRLRVLLADADSYIAAQKPIYWNEARAQMALAHAADPLNDALRLGLAVLLLKTGDAGDLARALVLLGEIAPSAPGRAKVQQAEYDLTRGIGAALSGNTDAARRLLTLALGEDPHCRAAKAAQALLP